MKRKSLRKNDLTIINVANELMSLGAGDRLRPVVELSEEYEVSVGTVQKSIKYLESEGCMTLQRKGHSGTVVTSINHKELVKHTNLHSLICTMALPTSKKRAGLAAGLKSAFEDKNVPFYFAHMKGSIARLSFLEKGNYDYAIVSKLAAKKALEEGRELDIVCGFGDGSYVDEYAYFTKKGKKKVKKVGIDNSSDDHKSLTELNFSKEECEFVDVRYDEIPELILNGQIDGAIYGIDILNEKVGLELDHKKIELWEQKEACEAVLMTRRSRKVLKSIGKKIVDPEGVRAVQQDVVDGKIVPMF